MYCRNVRCGLLDQCRKNDTVPDRSIAAGTGTGALNYFWIVEQDAVVEWALQRRFHQLLQPYSTVRRWDDEIEF